MEKDIKYIILEKHDILNDIKYEVGKRYKLDKFNGIEIYGNVSDIDFLDYSFKLLIENVDIYKIEAYQTIERIDMYEDTDRVLYATDFKILKKINYKEINIKNKNSEIIFGFKNRDDCYIPFATEDAIFRKKDLDIILSLNRKNDRVIANYGFDEHLDYLSKHSEDEYCLEFILQFHRKCDYDMIKKRGYKIDDDVCDKNLLW